MGTLYYNVGIADTKGNPINGITGLFIWRKTSLTNKDDVLTYYASRTPPDLIEYEYVDDITFSGTTQHKYPTVPVVEFEHKYSDGAELCVARAILALQEKGLNK